MKYVALVRGVNVGGRHRVPQKEFQAVLERLGYRDVVIYLNSGNAVLSSDEMPDASRVQAALEAHFGFSIPTLILSGEKIQAIAASIPEEWANDAPRPDKSGQKSDVVYLFDDVNHAGVLDKLGYRPEVETMLYVDGAILAHVLRANQSKSSLSKIVGTPLYKQVTVRSVTTARKLANLVSEA